MIARARAGFRLLQVETEVEAPPATLHALRDTLAPVPAWACAAPPATRGALRVLEHTPEPGRWRVLAGERVVVRGTDAASLVPDLEWALTTGTVEASADRYLLFHAGAVAAAEGGVLLAGVSGSGKSTLVAGLVAHGFSYFSDEVAALDRATLRLHPFGRALCLKEGSRRVLAATYPALARGTVYERTLNGSVGYLRPPAAALPACAVPVRYLLFPRYEPTARTALTPLARGEALPLLLAQLFNPRTALSRDLPSIMAMLRELECYTLSIGTLDQAIARIEELCGSETRALCHGPRSPIG